jgi:hypothetical protein
LRLKERGKAALGNRRHCGHAKAITEEIEMLKVVFCI